MIFKVEKTNTIEEIQNVVEKVSGNTESKPAAEISQNVTEDLPPVTEPKKGRGRPKGSVKFKPESQNGNSTTEVKKEEPAKGKNVDDEIQKLRAEHNNLSSGGTQTIKVDTSTNVDKSKTAWLNGYLLLIVCDVFFPMAISFIMKKTMTENGKTRKHLKLSQKDKDEMMPLADAAAKELALTMSATSTFFVAMSFMYASKIDE